MGRPAVILAVILLAATARALPPDRLIHLTPGASHFEKAPRGTWQAVSSDPGVVTAQYFDTAEVFLQAKRVGSALVMLANLKLGQAWFWKIKVADEQKETLPKPAAIAKSCSCGKNSLQYPLTCKVETQACLDHLRQILNTSDLTEDQLKLHFTVETLQAQLKHLDQTLKSKGHQGIALSFSGVNLRITGQLPDKKAWHRLIMDVYEEMVGKLVIDNQIEMTGRY